MRLGSITIGAALLALAACDQGGVKEENVPEAAADAAAVDNALARDEAVPAGGAQDRTAEAGATDTRGTTGTAPVDGSGKPGTTMPTLPPDNPGDTPPTSPPT
jgi:hypothetical protein